MKRFRGIVLPLIIVLLWWIGAELNLFNSYIVPHPGKVLKTAIVLTQRGILIKHLGTSFYRVISGFICTFIIAFPTAILVAMNKRAYEYLRPMLEFIRHIPPIAMIPLLILFFGIGETSKLVVIILATFFPIFINTLSGIINCDKRLIEVGKIFCFSRREIFFKIILPQALPSVLAGMQLGLGYSWRSLMGAELIAASSGIGYMIIEAEQLSRIDIIFVGILLIGILGYGIDFLFLKLADKLLLWEDKNKVNEWNQNKEFIKNI